MEYIRLHQRGLVDRASLGYSRAVKPARPGIASSNRRRLGSFASLIDLILDDDSALDGLAFAYAELGEPERRALAQAVLQDSRDPTQALLAFLAVEESPTLRHRLAGCGFSLGDGPRAHSRVDCASSKRRNLPGFGARWARKARVKAPRSAPDRKSTPC